MHLIGALDARIVTFRGNVYLRRLQLDTAYFLLQSLCSFQLTKMIVSMIELTSGEV